MGDFLNEATPSGGSSTPWLNTILDTGLGVARLFTNQTPAAARTGTAGAPNWSMLALIGGGILLLVLLLKK